jgi:formate hydrogenlyase transcriptional activator
MDAAAPDALLRRIVEAVESATGADFLRSLVRSLAESLGVSYAFVSELTQGGTHFKTRGLWARGAFADDFEVPVAGTPCELVLGGRSAHYASGLQERFRDDAGLADWKAVGYVGVPILGPDGAAIGHFAIVHDAPLPSASPAVDVMRIFATRAAAELERQRIEGALRRSEARLQVILDTAMDGVVGYDKDFKIWLFNRAAERILRCKAGDALGRDAMLFATTTGGDAARQAIEHLERHPNELIFVGAEDGVTARRADGSVFVQEASLSRSEVGNEVFYTVIFRDAEERSQAGRELVERLRRQSEYLREEIQAVHNFEEIVGRSPALGRVLEDSQRVAETDASVLIRGETGTGKELFARAIHARSPRRERPLVKVNCAAFSPGLVESELFGHEKGAFTGAGERRIGRFELADGGTIFLDEVGEIPLDVQVKLLRVLQERQIERVGGERTIAVDVRVIAATNRDLEGAIAEGLFRQDLFYRLNVFPVRVPPLRERPEDIALLAHFFAARFAAKLGRRVEGVAPGTLERLRAYPWPGNVRELENVIERAVILARGAWVEVPPEVLGAVTAPPRAPAPAASAALTSGRSAAAGRAAASSSLDDAQRRHIREVLSAAGGRIEGADGAAARLGLSPSTLRSRMKKLGIRRGERDGS